MKTFLRTNKLRFVIAGLLAAFIPLGSLLFSSASALTGKAVSSSIRSANVSTAQTPTYVAGNFSFSTPQALTHAPIPAVSPCPLPTGCPSIKDQDTEPEIKVDIYGTIYVTAIHGYPGGVDLWKSSDKGTNFTYLGIPDGTEDQCVTGVTPCIGGAGGGDDSIDVSSGGYLYISSLLPSSVTMSVSYDGGIGGVEPGQKWEVNPASSGIPVNDRQWIAAYGPETVYMTFDQAPVNTTIWFTKSTDGGKTWATPNMLIPLETLSRENNVAVDQYNGNIYTTYTPFGKPNELHLLKSTDSGATWTDTIAYGGPATTCLENAFPIITVDRGGNVYVVFTQSTGCGSSPARTDAHVYLISSADYGATWTAPLRIDSGPGNNSTVMPWAVAGSPGVVDITWYGSSMASPDNTPANASEYWGVFFAQITNALSASPTIAQSQVVSSVHNLPICSRGGNCSGNTRDLAEYYTMTIDRDGNANIAYPDELNYCAANPAPNCFPHTYYTKQTSGPSAYNPPAGPAAATFASNIPVGSPGGEPGMKVDSHNCMFVTTPGNPWVWKSVNNGTSFLPPVNPVAVRARTAGDEDILPIPQANGARPDLLYFADLGGLVLINIAESVDGGANWFAPGPMGAAGQLDASSDRQWISHDRGAPNTGDLTVYEMDHEAASEAIRFSALTNDGVWSPPASGITSSEILLPPDNTIPNTNPGPVFVDSASHKVYGVFTASTIRTNEAQPPFGKLPNLWEAVGAAPTAAGQPPGPFTNVPVFKGVQDSPSTLPSPAPTPDPAVQTFGNNTANDFPSAAIDASGNIYVVWAMNNARTNEYMVWFASSHDHGGSFYGPFQVSQGPGAAVMPWIAAGDGGRVDIVYYATTTPVDPNIAPNSVGWNTMFAQSFNASEREPVFTISPVSHHIMHNGPICNQGILCGSGTRTLADFFQVSIGPDGLANIAYADNGPFPLPSGNPDTSATGTHAEFARQATGSLALVNPVFPTCLGEVVPLISVVSRKTHGTAGTFEINLPLIGTRGVECRTAGNLPGGATGDYQLVFAFPNLLTSVGGATVTGHNPSNAGGSVDTSMIDPTDAHKYIVNLKNVDNAQYLTVTLNNVVDSAGNAGDVLGPQLGVLIGDVNASGRTDSTDVTIVRSQTVQTPTQDTCRYDVNASGRTDATDVTVTRTQTVSALPSSP